MKNNERYASRDGSGIECIDAIQAALTTEEFKGFCKGNIIKYVWRENVKGHVEDVMKACDYAKYLAEFIGGDM